MNAKDEEPPAAAESCDPPFFDADFRRQFVELLRWRRDVREFRRDPLPPETFERLVAHTHLAPSVGLSEPWRFVLVETPAARAEIRENFRRANAAALGRQEGERAALYARLKLEGMDQAPVQFALFVDPETEQGHHLGRLTMPETAAYSAVSAIFIVWLAARMEGLGLGWVSILDPAEVVAALAVPAHWTLVGYFCLGYPAHPDDRPALERVGWEHRHGEDSHILRR
jgi:5,6-dimethylbenzimidazole synthase